MKQTNFVKPIKTIHALIENGLVKKEDAPILNDVIEQFSLAITPSMIHAIDKNDPHDPVAMQFVPQAEELTIASNEREDPIGDESFSSVKGIIHRYPDRCLFTPVHVCPVYCRFCFRREKVGSNDGTLTTDELENAYIYIEKHPEIWEVILTGGDPLILKPKMLASILKKLQSIHHVEIIRIHTRVPIVEPHRINKDMVSVLSQKKPIYIVLHANHSNEFTSDAIQACASLVDAGIPMLSQSVLLKGINDTIEILSQLMRCFIKNRIKPYYLHQGDLAKGTGHFRTTITKGQSLMKELRGRFSGICQPTYVLDIPGGHGKSPIGPNYLSDITTGNDRDICYKIEDYQGISHVYTVSSLNRTDHE